VFTDKGTNSSLGFGLTERDLNLGNYQEMPDPESSGIAQFFAERPVAKFFATATATIVAAAVSGSVVRGVGTKGLQAAARKAAKDDGLSRRFMGEYRKVQGIFDEYGGIHRTQRTGIDIQGGKVVHFNDPSLDITYRSDSFIMRQGARERARELGEELPAEWTFRDEMQQQLIRSARRLPYELPAVYLTQRTFTDHLLDEGPEDPVNWSNPVDIIGDFAEQSIKNVAFAFAPFEGAKTTISQGWRRALTTSVDQNAPSLQRAVHRTTIDLNDTLKLIGHEASDLLAKGVSVSSRSLGAMATSMSQTASKQQSLTQTYHSMRHGKDGFLGWLDRVRTGEEVFSPVNQMRDIARSYRETIPKRVSALDDLHTQIYGGSKFENVLSSLRNLQGSEFSSGSFYQAMSAAEYKKLMARNLSDLGVEKRVSQEFADIANFTLPIRPDDKRDISHRIFFGKKAGGRIDEGTGSWFDAFSDRIEPKFKGHGKKISNRVQDALKKTDAEYMARKPHIDQNIGRAWNRAYKDLITPQIANNLGLRQAAFAEFGSDMTSESGEFLVRRSAERLGISTITEHGQRISTADLRTKIRGYGLDSTNRQQLRSFLIEKGDISKPWNPSGRNLLGLRPMSIQDGLDKKAFGPEPKGAEELAQALARTDWDPNILNRIQMGGVYSTARGGVLNLNPIRQGGRKMMDVLANELEVPILHFNPLQMFGYGARREASQQGAIQFFTGKQPFTGKDVDADGFFWFQKGFGSKGQVATIKMGDEARPNISLLEGLYRPLPVDQSMAGRAVHLGAGDDLGRKPVQRQGLLGRILDRMDYDEYQQGSVGGAIRRMRNRRDDISKPSIWAEKAAAGDLDRFDPADAVGGFRAFLNQLRQSSISRRIGSQAREGSRIRKLTHIDEQDIFDMDANTLRQQARRLASEDPTEVGIKDRARAKILSQSQKRNLRWSEVEDLSAMDRPLHGNARTGTLNQNIDQMRADMMRHLAIREGLKENVTPDEFRKNLGEMIAEINGMQGRGVINSREAAEARAAIGSIQASFSRYRSTDSRLSDQQNLLNLMDNMLGSKPSQTIDDWMQQILDDTANHGVSGRAAGKIRKYIAPAQYQYPGVEYNPFGTPRVLTPTFGTAFARHPIKATLSAAGVGTWKDPESFSGAGIPVSHIFDRMNRATQAFGLGVDSSQYGGPLDMFFRGMVMKRAVPLVAGGTTLMAADRTAGGYVLDERDSQGERIYQPLVTGGLARAGVEAHSMISGVVPGGQTYAEKKEELLHGEVAVRRGRWWPFGNTPWRGGQIDRYEPSWYRRFTSGYQYSDQTFGSPMERLMFGHDFSPLRPFDPYRFERKHYDTRPYPETGDYFSGPWGPATGILNMTVGRVLKPKQRMHEEELQYEMSRYQQVGSYGMAPPSTAYALPGQPNIATAIGMYEGAAGTPAYTSGSRQAGQDVIAQTGMYSAAARNGPATSAPPWYTSPPQYPFMVDNSSINVRAPSNVTMASEPLSTGSLQYQASEAAFLTQEWAGIYGFAFGTAREMLGLGGQRFESQRPVFAQASQAYGTGRQFWDLDIGGLGDFPTPVQGMGSLEASEIVRRFIPKPRSNQELINPLKNQMGLEHPWLPGYDYFQNFHTGDPYVQIKKGEMRLPGTGYERFNELNSDETGRYGRLDRFKILADVAPYSNEFRVASAELRNSSSGYDQQIYEQTMARVQARQQKYEFTPYEHKYEPGFAGAPEAWERFKHMDTYFHQKIFGEHTAIEEWERNHVFGSSFPEWQKPIESFLQPAVYKATDQSPLRAGVGLAIFGGLFGSTPRSKSVLRLAGGLIGSGASMFSKAYEGVTGDRYVPFERKQEVAIEEYTDILSYTRALRGFNLAQEYGDANTAQQFKEQMKSTMYGADLYDSTPEELARALPKRKREHFRAFLGAPEEERDRILSTAGRLERRIYQAAWGMRVERRPELEGYFSQHELPGPEWTGWDPRVGMENVEIKMIQQQGLNASQMGYYPQQVRQANLINVSYPAFGQGTRNPRAELERLMSAREMYGDVREIRTPYPGVRVQVNSGV
jgi:hypothetical protein